MVRTLATVLIQGRCHMSRAIGGESSTIRQAYYSEVGLRVSNQAQGKYRVAVSNITPMSNEVEYAAQILFAARRDGWGIQTSVYPVDWDDGKIKAVHSRYQQLLNPGP